MPRNSTGQYPDDWDQIATSVKDEADWRCLRCGHEHDPAAGYTLTVHHLDLDKSNSAWWNLAALCQRCHLRIQNKVVMEQTWMFSHSAWMKPFVAGYYAHRYGLDDGREYVLAHLDELLLLEKPWQIHAGKSRFFGVLIKKERKFY